MKRKKKFNLLKAIILSFLMIALVLFVSFYVLIVLGASKSLQEIWVCTAMTTMNHKYLATWFIPEEKINEILKRNKIDDTKYNSDIISFETNVNPSNDEINEYVSEGYAELEEGIYLKEISGDAWRGYVMLISNPLRVQLCDTKYQFNKGQTVKSMVETSGAVAGINGGGFMDGVNYDSNGGNPAGLLIENGVLISPKESDETTYNIIGINSDGVLILRHCTAEWAIENDIVSAVSFSPFIVVNGEGVLKEGSGGWGIAPRSAIGQRANGEILFLVVDGRQLGWSIGCDVDVLQEVLLNEKAVNGAMLDGGSSTVLYYNGEYINRPSLGHERLINNCFIVTK